MRTNFQKLPDPKVLFFSPSCFFFSFSGSSVWPHSTFSPHQAARMFFFFTCSARRRISSINASSIAGKKHILASSRNQCLINCHQSMTDGNSLTKIPPPKDKKRKQKKQQETKKKKKRHKKIQIPDGSHLVFMAL